MSYCYKHYAELFGITSSEVQAITSPDILNKIKEAHQKAVDKNFSQFYKSVTEDANLQKTVNNIILNYKTT